MYYNDRDGPISPSKQDEIEAVVRKYVTFLHVQITRLCPVEACEVIRGLAAWYCFRAISYAPLCSCADMLTVRLNRILTSGESRVHNLLKSKEVELHRVSTHATWMLLCCRRHHPTARCGARRAEQRECANREREEVRCGGLPVLHI